MRFVLCSVLEFDDGTFFFQELHRGGEEECRRLASLIPAVAYSGGKRVVSSTLRLPTAAEFDEAVAESETESQPQPQP